MSLCRCSFMLLTLPPLHRRDSHFNENSRRCSVSHSLHEQAPKNRHAVLTSAYALRRVELFEQKLGFRFCSRRGAPSSPRRPTFFPSPSGNCWANGSTNWRVEDRPLTLPSLKAGDSHFSESCRKNRSDTFSMSVSPEHHRNDAHLSVCPTAS